MRARRLAIGLGATAAVAACGCGGADPNSGITAYLRASNAQFVEGTMPASSGGSEPAVRAVNLINTTIYPGQENFGVSGSVEGGVSALVGLAGDSGYWIVPAPQVDPVNAGNYTFATSLTFSPLLPIGPQTLVLKAVDPQGTIGPELDLPLVAKAPIPDGALVFTLTWDTQADLDLHVVIPNTADPTKPIEIWSRAPVGLPPLGPADPPYDTATTKAAPYLDFDSNANCVIDGRRQENVIFSLPPGDDSFVPVAPPPGDYIVRVDTFSMCGQAAAQWEVQVNTPSGPLVNPATWESTDSDTRGDHGPGAGRLALHFTLPM
jgi:hypothetical protein